MLHELLTTELLLNLWQTKQSELGCQLLQIERRSIPSQSAFAILNRDRGTRLEPDAWFLYRQETKGMKCCFCELDTGTMTKEQVGAKFWRYEIWAASAAGREFLIDLYKRHGASDPHPTFRILAVACDREQNQDHRRVNILREAAHQFNNVTNRLRVTAASDLIRANHVLEILNSQQPQQTITS